MFAFRDQAEVDSGFGQQLVEVLRRSASMSTARRAGYKRFFLYDTVEGLQAVEHTLSAIRRESRSFYQQQDELRWALAQCGSLLVVRHGGQLHYMASEDEDWFEVLLSRPFKVKSFLEDFRGVQSRHAGHLRLVS